GRPLGRRGASPDRRRLASLSFDPGLDPGDRARDRAGVLPRLLRRLVPGARPAAARDGQNAVRDAAEVGPRTRTPVAAASENLRGVSGEGLSYAAAGVDIEAYERVLERVKPLIAATQGKEVAVGVGPFAGVYALGDYDLAGFIVGMVEAGSRREPIKAGDLLVGLPSTGLHTNGYSLARKVFANVPLSGVLADELMAPHVSYLGDLAGIRWKGAAHITGGGILGNLPRCLPDGIAARLDRAAWTVPPIFDLIRERGRVADDEMYATFNMGLGMILVVAREAVPPGALVVGQVVRQTGPERVMIS